MEQTEFSLIPNLTDIQIDQLVALYKNEFWCNTRLRPDVEKMLLHTDVMIGAIDTHDKLIGYVRVLTDYIYKATIYDLIVHPDWRNKNLGRKLMDAIIYHPKLRDVQHFDLHCLPAMYPFYEKWGFTTNLGKVGIMRRIKRET